MNSRIDHQAGDQQGRPNEELTILDDRYALDFPLTYAASGTAWLATDTFTAGAKRVVVKFLSRLDEADADELVLLRTRFTPVQMQAAGGLPRIENLGGFEAEPFIVFSRLEGQSLDEYLTSHAGGSSISMAALLQFADAVRAMHAAGVLHLDIAPAHLTYDAGAEAVRLLDWGHALAIDSSAPPLEPASDLAIYAGPGLFGELDPQPRDDVYSAACVIYELLAGQHPYGGRTASAAAAAQLSPAPIAALHADQNAVLALALSTTRRQPAIDMAQLIAAFARAPSGAARTAERMPNAALESTPTAVAPRPMKMPAVPNSIPSATPASALAPAAAATNARPAASSTATSGAGAARPEAVSAKQPAAPATDGLAARTASIEAMIARDHTSRVKPPSDPDPELIEPSIAHELISADDTLPPRSVRKRADEAPAAPASALHEPRHDPFISSPSLPPAQSAGSRGQVSMPPRSQGPMTQPPKAQGAPSQPPRSHAPFSKPPAAQAPHSQPPRSKPTVSQPPLSQPPLSQPPLVERGQSQSAGQRSRPMEADLDQVFRGTEFETGPGIPRKREWAVTLPLGLTITLASCVIGVVAGVWLAGSGASAKRGADAPATAPAQSEVRQSPAVAAPAAETNPAAVAPAAPTVAKPAADATAMPPGDAAKSPADTTQANAAPKPAVPPVVAPAVGAAPATVAPSAGATPKPAAPVIAAPKPAAPPVAAAPRPPVVPRPAPAAAVPAAPEGVDLLDATMATRALTERVARETEEELARQRAGKQ